MKEGMSINAQTEFGLIEIYAGKGCERTFKWDNESYTIVVSAQIYVLKSLL